MPSNNSKYSHEMREQTAAYILETGKSVTSTAEEKGLKPKPPKDNTELTLKIRELEKQIKEKDKEIELQKKKVEEEKIKVKILKKSLHIFMQPQE